MPEAFWDELYNKVEIDAKGGTPVPKPTADQLDEFERSHSMRLPPSYREYILRFGPGQLCGTDISAPGYEGVTKPKWDLWHRISSWPSVAEDFDTIPEEKENLRWFGLHYKTLYLWNVTERDDAGEYCIWEVQEDGECSVYERSFLSFVMKLSDEAELRLKDPDYDYDEVGPVFEFQPALMRQ